MTRLTVFIPVSLITIHLMFCCGCSNSERKVFVRRVDFEVDPKANKGSPFVCNIVVPYSSDLVQKLHGMDAPTYFTQLPELRRLYKDKLEIFSYDIIPGKSKVNQKIEPRSRTKAYGAYIFAKYSVNGKFAERLGLNRKIIVKFEEYKMTIYDGKLNMPKFEDKCMGKCPKKDLPKTNNKSQPMNNTSNKNECIDCPPNTEYAMVCENGTTEYYPKEKSDETKKQKQNKNKKTLNVDLSKKYDDYSIIYYDEHNNECVKCPEGSEFLQECDDGTVVYLPDYKHVNSSSGSQTKSKNLKTNASANVVDNKRINYKITQGNNTSGHVSKKSQQVKH